jgi:hypothetical protein
MPEEEIRVADVPLGPNTEGQGMAEGGKVPPREGVECRELGARVA